MPAHEAALAFIFFRLVAALLFKPERLDIGHYGFARPFATAIMPVWGRPKADAPTPWGAAFRGVPAIVDNHGDARLVIDTPVRLTVRIRLLSANLNDESGNRPTIRPRSGISSRQPEDLNATFAATDKRVRNMPLKIHLVALGPLQQSKGVR